MYHMQTEKVSQNTDICIEYMHINQYSIISGGMYIRFTAA